MRTPPISLQEAAVFRSGNATLSVCKVKQKEALCDSKESHRASFVSKNDILQRYLIFPNESDMALHNFVIL